MPAAERARQDALDAAQRRLKRAAQFVELSARKPLFEKVMRADHGRRFKVALHLPGPVLVQFDPQTGEIFCRSKPGQIDQLDSTFLDE